jgi:hypothetical protein
MIRRPGRRSLCVDPRPIGRAVPRSADSHDVHTARRPDAGQKARLRGLGDCPRPARSRVSIEVTPDHARAALQSP